MKTKHFVRPTCSKQWYFTCVVCAKKHHKFSEHQHCYRRFCDPCQEIFDSAEALREHALKWHKKQFCEKCNMTVKFIKKHKTNFH